MLQKDSISLLAAGFVVALSNSSNAGWLAALPTDFSFSEQLFGRLLKPTQESTQVLTFPAVISPTGQDIQTQPIVVPGRSNQPNIPLQPPASPIKSHPWIIFEPN